MDYKQIIAAIEADENAYADVPAPTDEDYVESDEESFVPTDQDMAEADLAKKLSYAEEYLSVHADENWNNETFVVPSYEDYISGISGTDIKDEDKLTKEEYSNLEQYIHDYYLDACSVRKTIDEYEPRDHTIDYPDEWLSH